MGNEMKYKNKELNKLSNSELIELVTMLAQDQKCLDKAGLRYKAQQRALKAGELEPPVHETDKVERVTYDLITEKCNKYHMTFKHQITIELYKKSGKLSRLQYRVITDWFGQDYMCQHDVLPNTMRFMLKFDSQVDDMKKALAQGKMEQAQKIWKKGQQDV